MPKLAVAEIALLEAFFASPVSFAPFAHHGLSRQGFALIVNDKKYFVKSFESPSEAGLVLEKQVSKLTTQSAISPEFITQSGRLLIYDFIEHSTLKDITISIKQKISVVCALLAQFQQLPKEGLPTLNVQQTTLALVFQCQLSDQLNQTLTHCINHLPLPNIDNNFVLCHGDLNFANIIKPNNLINIKNFDNNNAPQQFLLIDFESSCIAHAEFDIAMMIAINRLDNCMNIEDITDLVREELNLIRFSKNKINDALVTRYLSYCFLINGLWYFSKGQQLNSKQYFDLAFEQFDGFDTHFINQSRLLDKMRQAAN